MSNQPKFVRWYCRLYFDRSPPKYCPWHICVQPLFPERVLEFPRDKHIWKHIFEKKELACSRSGCLRMYPQEYASYYSNNKATYGFSEGFRTFRFWSHEKIFKIERSSADTVKIVENSVFAEIYCWALLYTQHTYGLTQLRFLPILLNFEIFFMGSKLEGPKPFRESIGSLIITVVSSIFLRIRSEASRARTSQLLFSHL